jgi:hypothetical protein
MQGIFFFGKGLAPRRAVQALKWGCSGQGPEPIMIGPFLRHCKLELGRLAQDHILENKTRRDFPDRRRIDSNWRTSEVRHAQFAPGRPRCKDDTDGRPIHGYGQQARRRLAPSAAYEDAARTQAAKIGGVTAPILRDWKMKLDALESESRIVRKAPGRPPARTMRIDMREPMARSRISKNIHARRPSIARRRPKLHNSNSAIYSQTHC